MLTCIQYLSDLNLHPASSLIKMILYRKQHTMENRIFAVSSPSNTRQNQFMLL
jgi:hypothetical protein